MDSVPHAPHAKPNLRRISKKRARQVRRRRIVVDIALARDGHCVGLDLIDGHECHGPLVGHEPLKRSAGGNYLDPDQVLTVCSWLNSDIEDRPWLYKDSPLWVSSSTLYRAGRYMKGEK